MLGNGCRSRVALFVVPSSVATTASLSGGPGGTEQSVPVLWWVLTLQENCACVATLDTAMLARLCGAGGSVCAAALLYFVFLCSV